MPEPKLGDKFYLLFVPQYDMHDYNIRALEVKEIIYNELGVFISNNLYQRKKTTDEDLITCFEHAKKLLLDSETKRHELAVQHINSLKEN